ncbi:MAG: S53 family peptidase [Acidimicrobiales bacterium]|jgi:subtilase family serine protease
MKAARSWALLGSVGLVVSVVVAMAVPSAASATSARSAPRRVELRGSLAPAAERAHPRGKVSLNTQVKFDLLLTLRNASGAEAFVKAVSDPGSALYRHYLSDAQWNARFAPSRADVARAESWLRKEGFVVGSVPKDRLFVSAKGTALQVELAFGVTLGYFDVNGHTVRLANGALSIPASLAGIVSGVLGVNQYLATTDLALESQAPAKKKAKPAQEPAPPAGFRNPQPCSSYWGQKTDTADASSLYAPYTAPLPYDTCGYKPAQLEGAYGLSGEIKAGDNGSGVAIAIVDAYDSPTLFSDTHRYFQQNDPAIPLKSSQFINLPPSTVDDQAECDGSGWYPEQALDVEASHTMAPGADILFVGAQDCFDSSLLTALTTAVESGASVVTDSWGDTLGDLFDDAATHAAFDDTFMMADVTGVSVLFSSGDDGDNFAISGIAAPDYPASSPYVTAVGGTTLEINGANARTAEYGWSTGKQVLCETSSSTTSCGSSTAPAGALAFQVGGGGGTSYYYTQPYYQASVVPSDLALRNEPLFGPVPLRVLPDISMDADAQTGMLIGLTQTFPDGVYYDQFKEGGTSLASPLLAGVVADADQAAGIALGFLNPTLYKAYSEYPTAFNDIVPPSSPDSAAVIRVDYANSVNNSAGYIVSLRVFDYQGPETYCDGTGNCATRPVTLTTAAGFDSMTGLGSVGGAFIWALSKF